MNLSQFASHGWGNDSESECQRQFGLQRAMVLPVRPSRRADCTTIPAPGKEAPTVPLRKIIEVLALGILVEWDIATPRVVHRISEECTNLRGIKLKSRTRPFI